VIAGLAAFGIHELRKQANEEYPEGSYDELFGSTKDRVVAAAKSGGANIGERASKLRLPEAHRPEGGGSGGGSGGPVDDQDARLERLERLGALHEKGILSDEELAAEKARLLNADD
jgi:hypothetical protein